jgi:hypothetical protein
MPHREGNIPLLMVDRLNICSILSLCERSATDLAYLTGLQVASLAPTVNGQVCDWTPRTQDVLAPKYLFETKNPAVRQVGLPRLAASLVE